ncbi:PKD domain-containing protein [Lacibacter sp. MH-610]|uniref:PKD domain-containing protein n=1 Tax=Lacibacter sp. MH-610 TaxID=3020883 RepID=UPI0038929F41
MRRILLFACFWLLFFESYSQTFIGRQLVDQFPRAQNGNLTYALTWLPANYATTGRSYPLIIFLHGSGETGTTITDLNKLLNHSLPNRIANGWDPVAVNPKTGLQDSFIVVSPQASSWSYSYTDLKFILPAILAKYRVNTNRIYLTGLSAGGGGVFSTFGSRDPDFLKNFAAMVTASSAGTNASNGYTAVEVEEGLRFGSSFGVRKWTVAGENDYLLYTDVRYHDSTNMLNPFPRNKLTVIQGVGHSAWTRAFDPAFRPVANYYGNSGNCQNGCNNGGIPVAPNANGSSTRGSGVTQDSLNMYEWLLLYERSNNTPANNIAPVANAGPDQTTTLPTNSVVLNGSSSDADGLVIAHLWTKISGPSEFTINTPMAAQTTISNLVKGVYQFELRATDDKGVHGRDTVTVTVNTLPGSCGGRRFMPNPGGDRGFYNSINLQPGDTLYIDGTKSWSYIYIADKNGTPECPIVIMNIGGQARLTGQQAQISLYNCTNIKVLGNGTANVPYGFYIQPYPDDTIANGTFAVNIAGRSKSIEIGHVSIRNAGMGIVIKEDGGCDPMYNYPNWVLDSMTIHDNRIVNTWNQGMYMGNTSPDNGPTSYSPRPVICNGVTIYPRPARLGNIKVYNNYVDSTGRGGIQLSTASTGYSEIYNNVVKHSGLGGDEGQGSGILVGGYTRAYIHDNTIVNTLTYGISSFGASGTNIPLRIENNITDSSGYLNNFRIWALPSGTWQLNLRTATVYQNLLTYPYSIFLATKPNMEGDSTMFWVKNNTLGLRKNANAGIGLADYQNTFHKVGNVICNNMNAWGGLAGIQREEVTPVIYSTNCATPPNQVPVANAGPDQTITLPTNSVTLNGSGTDADGTIASYQWTKVAGPAQGSITNAAAAQTTVTALVQGTYRFELRVTDNNGAIGRDTMTVTVNAAAPPPNQAPVANAGPDQTITLPTNSVTLTGSGTDTDGSIASYQWTKVAGPAQGSITNAAAAQTTVTAMAQGTYRFELRVTDNNGAIGRDTMTVTVNAAAPPPNQAPVANAGPDQTITLPTNSVTLNGSGTDADGTIASYQWTKVAGPAQGSITNAAAAQTTVTALVQGTYRFELRVTDNNGAIGRDTMTVTVNAAAPPPNQAPVANAGPDQTITLPTNSVTLNGSGTDADGTIASYQWTKVAGPAQGSITNAAAAQTTVTALVQGTYRFELRVTDNNGAIGRDTMTVTVNAAAPPPNQAPVANAGPDQTITLPTNSVTLNGSGTDADGTIASYQWTKVAGPAQGSITNAAAAQTTVTALVQGTYRFELRVTDNNGAIGRDTMTVTVNAAAPPPNQAPIAYAGPDQTITLPTNSVTLNGSGTDADGTIASYQWVKIAGPALGIVTNAAAAQTTLTSLVQGTYRFELRVTDNNGAIGRDTMTVTVNGAPLPPNQAPVANAGADQTINLPTNSVTLNGNGTDADGTIASYQWIKVAGPAQFTITNASSAQTIFKNLVEGQYVLVLKVTDNKGAVGTDTLVINVAAAPEATGNKASIYPNPAKSVINIDIHASTKASKTLLKIYDAFGKVVYQKEIMRDQPNIIFQVDVSGFLPGTYFVQIGLDMNTNKTISFIKM